MQRFLARTVVVVGLFALAETTLAADMAPAYKSPSPQIAAYNWSGFYVGAHAGYGWADKFWRQTATNNPALPLDYSASSAHADGFLGGAQLGVNWQTGAWVFGVEGDWSWTNADGCANSAVFINYSNCADVKSVTAHLLLAGNAYIENVPLDGAVRELHALRPDRMRVVPGGDGWPEAYDYHVAGRTLRFEQNGPLPPILHLSQFHPLDDHYGLSALEAAAVAVDTHNAAANWNKALLDNAARPCGALVYAGPDATLLTDNQFERLKAGLDEHYQGAKNAGRPMLLEGGLDWKPMSLTPKDMDFLDAKHNAAREIALAFGVPPMLLGIPGDNTYANYQEANRALWRATVLPLAARLGASLAQWLAPAFGELRLMVDTDRIEALSHDRAALWERVSMAAFLTVNEKRAAVGYAPVESGDVFT